MSRGDSRWQQRRFRDLALAALMASSIGASAADVPDFDDLLHRAGLDGSVDGNSLDGGNGLVDGDELALLAEVIRRADAGQKSPRGSVPYEQVRQHYEERIVVTGKALGTLTTRWPTAARAVAGYSLLGPASHARIAQMMSGFGAELPDLDADTQSLARWLGPDGDADGDGLSNHQEYRAHIRSGRVAFVAAALDANIRIVPDAAATEAAATPSRLKVGVILYPGFEALDVYGPLQMWGYVPNFEVLLVAETMQPVKSSQQYATVPTHTFDTAPQLDIVMVPGGIGTFQQLDNRALLNFLRRSDKSARYVSSVCTGSALLARSGLLDGARATTNKRFFFLAEQQGPRVDWVPAARWVESGKYFTSSGVSAGTDMALGLIAKVNGRDSARELASLLEYEWSDDASRDPFADKIQRLPPQASGPAELLNAAPAAGAVLDVAPRALTLRFNRTPEVPGSAIELRHQNGRLIPLRSLHSMGDNDLMVLLDGPLSDGQYDVRWRARFARTTAAAEHELKGGWTFSLKTQP